MKRNIIIAALMVVGLAQADITENHQIGGLLAYRDAAWNNAVGNGALGLDDKHAQYTFASATDSQLEITVHLEANYAFDWDATIPTELDNTPHVGVNDGVGNAGRIDGDEWVKVTISYVDPNNNLTSLKVNEFGAYWGNNATETTVFTDASANSYDLIGFQHAAPEVLIDYSTTGLDALTKDNTGTWSMTVSADDTLGITTTGLGGFELEYTVVPEPATFGLLGLAGAVIFIKRKLMKI